MHISAFSFSLRAHYPMIIEAFFSFSFTNRTIMYVMERVTITQFLVMEAVKVWISSCASLEINVTVIGIIATMKNIVMMDLMRVGHVKPGMCNPKKYV